MRTACLFTGLPGAGKTTLAHAVAEELRARGRAATVIDGDVLRQASNDRDFSLAGRLRQAERAAQAAQGALASGCVPLLALVAPDLAARAQLRAALPGLYEVRVMRSATCRPAWAGTVYEIGGADLTFTDATLAHATAAVVAALGAE